MFTRRQWPIAETINATLCHVHWGTEPESAATPMGDSQGVIADDVCLIDPAFAEEHTGGSPLGKGSVALSWHDLSTLRPVLVEAKKFGNQRFEIIRSLSSDDPVAGKVVSFFGFDPAVAAARQSKHRDLIMELPPNPVPDWSIEGYAVRQQILATTMGVYE